jgi:protein gp37
MKETKIEWTNSTWNPLIALRKDSGKRGWYCQKISPECDHCYAAAMNQRSDGLVGIGNGDGYAPDQLAKVDIQVHEKTLLQPLRWSGPRKVFVCSMTDLFGEWHTDAMIDRVFAIMAMTPHITYQVLTKRPSRMLAYCTEARTIDGIAEKWANTEAHKPIWIGTPTVTIRSMFRWPLPNVWLGVTAGNQAMADERVPVLLRTPAAKRFVSYEPALGPVDLTNLSVAAPDGQEQWDALDKQEAEDAAWEGECGNSLDWLIMGGESGPKARPMNPEWAWAMRDQCERAGVPFFFKQWGEFAPLGAFDGFKEAAQLPLWYVAKDGTFVEGRNGQIEEGTRYQPVYRVGKKRAGRLLQGVEYSQFPGDSNA